MAQGLPESEEAPDLLQFAMGHYDTFGDDKAVDFRIEYRSGKRVLLNTFQPWGGAELTSDASLWLGGGLLYNWNIAPDWTVTPSIGAGVYSQGESDLDLGFPIAFRTQLEVSYQYENGIRMGGHLSHLSNANLDDHNPGTEVMGLSLGYPF